MHQTNSEEVKEEYSIRNEKKEKDFLKEIILSFLYCGCLLMMSQTPHPFVLSTIQFQHCQQILMIILDTDLATLLK
jgi:hypothetical protein